LTESSEIADEIAEKILFRCSPSGGHFGWIGHNGFSRIRHK
jgi:hypothetical protein